MPHHDPDHPFGREPDPFPQSRAMKAATWLLAVAIVVICVTLATLAFANPFEGRPKSQAFMAAALQVCGKDAIGVHVVEMVAMATAKDLNVPIMSAASVLRYRGAETAKLYRDSGMEDVLCTEAGRLVKLISEAGY